MVEELITLEEEAKRAEEQDGARKDAAAGEKKKKTGHRNEGQGFGETRKRHEEEKEDGKKEIKRGRSGGEALEWLKEKGEIVRKMKEQEGKDRKEETEMQRMQHEQFMKQLEANQRPQTEQMRMF